MGRIDGKVVVVTGAARGQGAAEAALFAAEGARVVLADVLDDEGRRAAQQIGERALYHSLDVADEAGWSALVAATLARFGRIDALVNNAGIVRVTPLADTKLEEFMQVLRVNLVGVFLGMRAVIPALRASGGGAIVNISSIDGLVGMAGGASYVSSKFGVRGLTKTAALELGRLGIRVNSIHPGGIDTPMVRSVGVDAPTFSNVPLGRIGKPEEVARLALFLISDESSYSTGSEFVIDGGLTAGFSLSDY